MGIVNVVVDAKSSDERLNFIVGQTKPTLGIGLNVDEVRCIDYQDLSLPLDTNIEVDDCNPESTADIIFTSVLQEDLRECFYLIQIFSDLLRI